MLISSLGNRSVNCPASGGKTKQKMRASGDDCGLPGFNTPKIQIYRDTDTEAGTQLPPRRGQTRGTGTRGRPFIRRSHSPVRGRDLAAPEAAACSRGDAGRGPSTGGASVRRGPGASERRRPGASLSSRAEQSRRGL